MKHITKYSIFLFMIFFLSACNQSTPSVNTSTELNTTEVNQETNGTVETQEEQRYRVYSEADFAAQSDKKRVLFFHATWCPTCKAANTEIEQRISEIPEDVVVYKTDYDTQKELKNKYAITYQHTFVLVDADGEEITKWNGGSIDEILENT